MKEIANYPNIKVVFRQDCDFDQEKSMEMMGASISICKLDSEMKELLDAPAYTPFYAQR